MATKNQCSYSEHNTNRRKNEINLRIVLQYFSQYEKLTDDRMLEIVAPGLTYLDFMKKNCPENTKLEDFCIEAGSFFKYQYFEHGDIIFNYGDQGDKVYIILKGEVAVLVPRSEEEIKNDIEALLNNEGSIEVFWQNRRTGKQLYLENLLQQKRKEYYFKEGVCTFKKIFQFYSGQSFGDVALVSEKPRTASILVVSAGIHLISMNKHDFQILCEKSVKEMNEMLQYFITLFPNVGRMQLTKFIQFFHKIEFTPQQLLWKEGDQIKHFIVIQHGTVEVKKNSKLIYQVQDGSFIGLDEIINEMNEKIYTCRTVDNTQAFFMELDEFHNAKKNAPDILKILIEKNQLTKVFLETRILELYKKPIQIESTLIPIERRTVRDMFQEISPRNNKDLRSQQQRVLSCLDIIKINSERVQKQKKIVELFSPKNQKNKIDHKIQVYNNNNFGEALIQAQKKLNMIKKYKFQRRFQQQQVIQITSSRSIYEQSRIKTDPF